MPAAFNLRYAHRRARLEIAATVEDSGKWGGRQLVMGAK
jgi:hypothetical protein